MLPRPGSHPRGCEVGLCGVHRSPRPLRSPRSPNNPSGYAWSSAQTQTRSWWSHARVWSPTFTKIPLTSRPSPRCRSGHVRHLRCSPSPPVALMPARGSPVICCGSLYSGHFPKAQSLPLVPVARRPLPRVSAGQPGALPTALWRPLWTDPTFVPQQLGDVSFPPVAPKHPPAIHHVCVDVPFQFPGEWTRAGGQRQVQIPEEQPGHCPQQPPRCTPAVDKGPDLYTSSSILVLSGF